MPPILRPALPADSPALQTFTHSPAHLHRHLDWRDCLAWLGRSPFWLLEEDGQIAAALACPPEPEEVAWVRLFAVSAHCSPDRAWNLLFERVLNDLRPPPDQPDAPAIVSLAMREWYEELLKRKGFQHHQDIVVFLYDSEPPTPLQIDASIRVREMQPADLPAVTVIDHLAFEPIWRLSFDDLQHALDKSSYCTVAEREGNIIGYTMSSSTGIYAHLARLAVHPSQQGQRLGFALVQELLEHFINRQNYWGVTLNTQHNNSASLALYHKIGFRETGERFPVYIYPDQET
jgi:[ribosomal protein S18]-alanine N-acetyltransferase